MSSGLPSDTRPGSSGSCRARYRDGVIPGAREPIDGQLAIEAVDQPVARERDILPLHEEAFEALAPMIGEGDDQRRPVGAVFSAPIERIDQRARHCAGAEDARARHLADLERGRLRLACLHARREQQGRFRQDTLRDQHRVPGRDADPDLHGADDGGDGLTRASPRAPRNDHRRSRHPDQAACPRPDERRTLDHHQADAEGLVLDAGDIATVGMRQRDAIEPRTDACSQPAGPADARDLHPGTGQALPSRQSGEPVDTGQGEQRSRREADAVLQVGLIPKGDAPAPG